MNPSDQTPSKTAASRPAKSGLKRLLVAVLAGGFVLVIGGYLVVTSSAFVTGVVLPMVGGVINSDLKAEKASLSPLSSVAVEQISLTPEQETPLFSADRVSVNYDLFDILGGQMKATDLVVDKPVVELVRKADGSLNLDPIFEALAGGEESTEPLNVDLKRLKVSDGTIRVRSEGEESDKIELELVALNIEVDRFTNGERTEIRVNGGASVEHTAGGVTSRLVTQFDDSVTLGVSLSDALLPEAFEIVLSLVVQEAEGLFADFADNKISLATTLGNNRLDPLSLSVSRGGDVLGNLSVSGPFNMDEGTADLEFALGDVSAQLVNQLGGLFGLSFGAPEVSANGGIQVTAGGQAAAITGAVAVQRLSVQGGGQSAPAVDVRLAFGVATDLSAGRIDAKELEFGVTQASRDLVSLKLAAPLSVALSDAGLTMSESRAEFSINELDLGDWGVFLGEAAAGQVNSQLTLHSGGGAGKSVRVVGETKVAKAVGGVDASLSVEADVAAPAQLDVSKLAFSVVQNGGPKVDGQASLSLGASGELSLQSEIALANSAAPAQAPVELAIGGNGQLSAAKTELKNLLVSLPPTESIPENQLNLTGAISPGSGAGMTGDLNLSAKTVDLTPLVDYWQALPAQPEAGTASPTETDGKEEEPAPMTLPVERLTASVNVDRLVLRDLDLTQWSSHVIVQSQSVTVDPFDVVINGAPLKAKSNLDLSVPGYRYEIAADVNQLPAGPLVGSAMPMLSGLYEGALDAKVDVKGQGITGVNLKQHLNGGVDLAFQGANIVLFDFWKKFFLTPVALVLRLPDLLDSPIQGVSVKSNFAAGVVDLAEFMVRSPGFQVSSAGQIPISDNLMETPVSLPIDFALRKESAVKANLVDDTVEANEEGFVTLPPFVALSGTMGEPQNNIDKVAVGKLFIRNVAGIPGSVVGKAGEALGGLKEGETASKVIDGVGNLLGEGGKELKNVGGRLRGLFGGRKKDEESEDKK